MKPIFITDLCIFQKRVKLWFCTYIIFDIFNYLKYILIVDISFNINKNDQTKVEVI